MNLPTIKLGHKSVKFLFFRPPNLCYFEAEGREPGDVPLFLGSDVLSGSSVLQKNFARIHTRYSKEGLASRLNLNRVSYIEGIPNSSALWFYTVQGLFRVTFEYMGQQVQRDCLELLSDTWLKTCDVDVPCPAETVELQLLMDEPVLQTLIADMPLIAEIKSEALVTDNLEVLHSSLTEQNLFEPKDVRPEKSVADSCNESMNTSDNSNVQEVIRKTSNEHRFLKLLSSLKECVDNYDLQSSAQDGRYINSLTNLIDLIRIEFSSDVASTSESGVVISLLEDYHQLLDEPNITYFENDFGIPVKTNIALCLFCQWIGKQFNSMTSVIAHKAEEFKLENIDRVHNLPKAESLIDILFPKCMKLLLFFWMSAPGAVELSQDQANSPPHKKPKQELQEDLAFKKPVFPFIQIILEFANSALVSGVAHVLHTRLLHDNS